jgi:hypothetical protein
MKKVAVLLISFFFLTFIPAAEGVEVVVTVTAPTHQNYSGLFINDELAQQLLPAGKYGQLVFTSRSSNKSWVVDAQFIDEVIDMSDGYSLLSKEEPLGEEAAISWLNQFKFITSGNSVAALAYGNPDISIAKKIAPAELKNYFAYGKTRLESFLGREVLSNPSKFSSNDKASVSNTYRRQYTENRKSLVYLSRVVKDPEVQHLRARLAVLLSPGLTKSTRASLFQDAQSVVDSTVGKLRINSGKYQITTTTAKLPITVINEFNSPVLIDIAMTPENLRMAVPSFFGVTVPAQSKKQLEMLVDVIAPGQTLVSAQITDSEGYPAVPEATLTLNSAVIDSRVTWFTTGAAILLLLAGVAQSVRRVKRRQK